jgi:chromosome segregation ATPase
MKLARSFTATISFLILTSIASFAQTVDPINTANPNASSQQASNLLLAVKQLAAEVKTLKTEVFKLKLELQQSKVERIEHELQEVRASKQRMDERDNESRREMAALDERLSQPIYENEERMELEAAKAKLTQSAQPRPRAGQPQISQREAELSQRLAREQETLQEMIEKAGKLGVEVPESFSARPSSGRASQTREH